MHICIDLNQSICSCMCLYVYCMQAHMHLIQLLCERRYMKIHAYTCRYINVCITYTSCISYMDCAYVMHLQAVCPSHTYTYINPYVCCMCFRYIHICIGRITDALTFPTTLSRHPLSSIAALDALLSAQGGWGADHYYLCLHLSFPA